jgi:hypothetical protein
MQNFSYTLWEVGRRLRKQEIPLNTGMLAALHFNCLPLTNIFIGKRFSKNLLHHQENSIKCVKDYFSTED